MVSSKSGKSPGIDDILADMIKDGGDLVQQCLLWLFNCMLASHFPERLSVGLITAVYKSGDKFDMGNYRGITVGSVVAKLFAMILEQRIASWAEEHAVKAKGQARFSKDFLTTDNIFILRSLIDNQKQSRQKGKAGKLYCCFVDFRKAFDTVPRAVLWQVLRNLVSMVESWTSSSLCMHTTAQQCGHHKAFLPSSDVSWG